MITGVAELGEYIDSAQWTLFRLETLDHYDVSSDGGDFRAYVEGRPGPDPQRKAASHKALQADLDRGIVTRRVHVLRSPLSDYLRYECEWGYVPNQRYEQIRILDVAETPLPAGLAGVGDYWLMDTDRAAVMHYGPGGEYLGFEPATDVGPYLTASELAWDAAEPFASWWDDHRQFWRSQHAA